MGRGRRDKVLLTIEQRQRLENISRNGYAPAKKILHARVKLKHLYPVFEEEEMADSIASF